MKESNKARVITICGSTRFKDEHLAAVRRLTLEGNVVLACPFYNHADGESMTDEQTRLLDWLHKQKIDMSDAVYVVNPGGYIGTSTMEEIKYAFQHGKGVIFMEEHK